MSSSQNKTIVKHMVKQSTNDSEYIGKWFLDP